MKYITADNKYYAQQTLLTTTFASTTALLNCLCAVFPKVLPFVYRPDVFTILTSRMIQSNVLNQRTDFGFLPLNIRGLLKGI